jgi:signal transduction histidine kinase
VAVQSAALEAYRGAARALAARIISAQEAERVRVSRELHDDTGQALALILVRLGLIEKLTGEPDVRRELAEVRTLVVDAIDGVRRLAVQLGPSVLEDLGLCSALEWLADRIREEGGIDVDLACDADDQRIGTTTALALFRVAQEALTNVVRHAGAARAWLRLRREGGVLHLTISDDGHGFDVRAARSRPTASVGLFGIAERVALVGGELDITATPSGTCIDIRVPLQLEATT